LTDGAAERRSSDRRGSDRRDGPDRRRDRRNAQRRSGERRDRSQEPILPESLPDTLEQLNEALENTTTEIDKVSAQLVTLLDRSRALFDKRATVMQRQQEEPS
jgi:hypothetical protein